MDSLVLCPCGHNMASHDWDGCRGDRFSTCGCRQSRQGALEAAIYASRLRGPQLEPLLASK